MGYFTRILRFFGMNKKMAKHTVQSLKNVLSAIDSNDTKNIEFPIIIEAFCGKKVLQIDRSQNNDATLIAELNKALKDCIANVRNNPIENNRVNEVGNYIEQPVIDAINARGVLRAERPKTSTGQEKSAGYPDIILWDQQERPTYLEVKTYNKKSADTTQRSFYLSPSDDFKVTEDARHLLVGFEVSKISEKKIYS